MRIKQRILIYIFSYFSRNTRLKTKANISPSQILLCTISVQCSYIYRNVLNTYIEKLKAKVKIYMYLTAVKTAFYYLVNDKLKWDDILHA